MANSAKYFQNHKKARPFFRSKRLQKHSERQQIPSNGYKSQKVYQIGFSDISDFAEFVANSCSNSFKLRLRNSELAFPAGTKLWLDDCVQKVYQSRRFFGND